MGHIPERMCSVCRVRYPKRELIRIALTPDGIFVDRDHTLGGRGAYICKKTECLSRCAAKKTFNRVFKRELKTELYEEIFSVAGKGE